MIQKRLKKNYKQMVVSFWLIAFPNLRLLFLLRKVKMTREEKIALALFAVIATTWTVFITLCRMGVINVGGVQ